MVNKYYIGTAFGYWETLVIEHRVSELSLIIGLASLVLASTSSK